MGIGVDRHHRKPLDGNQRNRGRCTKYHAGASRCGKKLTNAMVAERETEKIDGGKNACQVENGGHEAEPQETLVVAAVVADGLDFDLYGVIHLLCEQVRTDGGNHRADFLDGKGIRQVVLTAGVDRNHRRFQTEGAAFHVVGENDERLQFATDNRVFTFASVFTFQGDF